MGNGLTGDSQRCYVGSVGATVNSQRRGINRIKPCIEGTVVVSAQHQAISWIVCAASQFGADVGSVKKIKHRQPANRTPWTITLEHSEFEPLLPIPDSHFPRHSLLGCHQHEGLFIDEVGDLHRRWFISERNEESARLVVPGLHPAELHVTDARVGRRVRDDEEGKLQASSGLRRIYLGQIPIRRSPRRNCSITPWYALRARSGTYGGS